MVNVTGYGANTTTTTAYATRGPFEHGKEVGVFKFYSASNSDNPVIIKEYNENSDLADVRFYTPSGVLESEGKMRGKEREGKWLYYHEDGKSIMSEENYVNGKLDGEYKTFYPTGEPTEIAYYKNGLLHGNYKKYSIKGFLYQDFNYAGGQIKWNGRLLQPEIRRSHQKRAL